MASSPMSKYMPEDSIKKATFNGNTDNSGNLRIDGLPNKELKMACLNISNNSDDNRYVLIRSKNTYWYVSATVWATGDKASSAHVSGCVYYIEA